MNTYFPITTALSHDAEIIIHSLNKRSEEIKTIASQSLFRRLTIIAMQTLGLAAGLVTIACLPVAAIMFTATIFPLKIAAISSFLAITGLALSILFNPTSPGESIIKNQWKALFAALRLGDGALIVQTCQQLATQKEQRRESFNHCLGPLSPDETTPFLHKACLVGYLLLALQHLDAGEREQANAKAALALSHFQGSALPEEVQNFIKRFIDAPQGMQPHLKMHQHSQYPIHALDHILVHANLGG